MSLHLLWNFFSTIIYCACKKCRGRAPDPAPAQQPQPQHKLPVGIGSSPIIKESVGEMCKALDGFSTPGEVARVPEEMAVSKQGGPAELIINLENFQVSSYFYTI